MATASAPAAAPSAPRAPLARRILPPTLTVVGVAVLLKLIYGPWYLNYDARYALLWARDALRGLSPEYKADFAPTPHPLETAASMLAVPFGQGGAVLMSWLILLAFGLLVWLTYRLGAELFHPAVGVVAALVVLSRPALERDALLGYQDTAFAVLIVLAVLLEARRPRRGEAVLALLAVAGLMRPEAWVLGGLYLLWMWPRAGTAQRARLLGLTVLAPVVWAVTDAIVTGDPLHSLHGTADLAEAVDRRRDIVDAPYWTAQYYGYSLREPLVIGIPVGLFFAWRFRRREAILPLVVVAAMTLVFMIGPAFGLPLIGRYVRTPSVLLTLFYGLAVCGFLTLSDPRVRRLWMWIGIACAGLSIVFLPWHVGMLADLERRLDRDGAMYAALRDTAHAPAVRRAVEECGGRITATDYRPLPHLRWWLGTDPGSVGTTFAGASPRADVMLLPRRVPLMRRFYQENFPRQPAPPGWQEIYRNGLWRVVAAPGCVTRLRA
ncbi:MAG: hypothetical protein ACAH82_04700 [Solirubrobacteraceae bacterium]